MSNWRWLWRWRNVFKSCQCKVHFKKCKNFSLSPVCRYHRKMKKIHYNSMNLAYEYVTNYIDLERTIIETEFVQLSKFLYQFNMLGRRKSKKDKVILGRIMAKKNNLEKFYRILDFLQFGNCDVEDDDSIKRVIDNYHLF